MPKGRGAEDGVIPEKYPLTELDSTESHYRTEENIIKSDGTLIINKGKLTEGTKLTVDIAVNYGKPKLIVQLDAANGLLKLEDERLQYLLNHFAEVYEYEKAPIIE